MEPRAVTPKNLLLMNNLRIAALPLDIVQENIQANLSTLRSVVSAMEGADVLVLPELFSTGFVSNPEKIKHLAEENTGETVTVLKQLASTHGMAIAGSFLAREKGEYFNRGFFFTPQGEEYYYDKRHLFCLSPESKVLSAGQSSPLVVDYKGWKLSLRVCYDLRFPVWCRNDFGGETPYDILLFPANWPQARAYAWEHLLIARAIENQSYVVGANRGGTDEYGIYDGLTFIYDQWGKPIGSTTVVNDQPLVVAECCRELLEETRRRLPAWRDADNFRVGS